MVVRPIDVDDGDDVEARGPIRACEICHLVTEYFNSGA